MCCSFSKTTMQHIRFLRRPKLSLYTYMQGLLSEMQENTFFVLAFWRLRVGFLELGPQARNIAAAGADDRESVYIGHIGYIYIYI